MTSFTSVSYTHLQSKHSDDIALNEKLFARIKAVYENPGNLDKEQKKLLEETYKDFVRGGANLDADSQKKMCIRDR